MTDSNSPLPHPAATEKPAIAPTKILRKRWWPQVLAGATLSTLTYAFIANVTFAGPRSENVLLPIVIVGVAVYMTRFRRLLWMLAGTCAAMALVITYSPLVPWLMSGFPESDPLQPVDAVVALGAGVNLSDHSLGVNSQDRVIHALGLIQSGYAPRLIIPGAENSWGPTVEAQMRSLGIKAPMIDAGPAANTHDEANDVAAVLKARGWHHVILVTNAWHMHRAAAVFKKAGVDVLRSPCPDSRSDMINPIGLNDRSRALSCWIHEKLGYRIYQMRGWVD